MIDSKPLEKHQLEDLLKLEFKTLNTYLDAREKYLLNRYLATEPINFDEVVKYKYIFEGQMKEIKHLKNLYNHISKVLEKQNEKTTKKQD